ncbi:MAG: hypothetical protein JSV32_02235, partial [Dehalococcoidia bacterium]
MATEVSKRLRDSVKNFELEAADIILIHTKRSLWGWIIRRGTHCYWNHALMVHSPGSPEQSYNDTLVIDAKTGGTIEMDRLRRYLERKDKYDVAVKRLELDWFRGYGKKNKSQFRDRICSLAAHEAVNKSSSSVFEIIKQITRQIRIIIRHFKQKTFGKKKSPKLGWSVRPREVKAFTCGGFVQWCYYKGISQLNKGCEMDKSKQQQVIFNPRAKKRISPYELLT